MFNSKLLEEAIVDAEALREAALKNAEQTVLEKYAPEVKSAIENLLEQELPGGPDSMMGDEAAMTSEPNDGLDVSLAATDGEKLCPCPDESETVTVSLGDLKAKMEEILMDVASQNAVSEPMDMPPEEPMDMPPEEPMDMAPESEPVPPEEEEPMLETLEIDENLIKSILSEVVEEESEEEESEEEENEEEVKNPGPYKTGMKAGFDKDGDGVPNGADPKPNDGSIKENKILLSKNSKMLVENKKVLNENKLLTEKLEKLLEQHKELLEENKKVKQTALQISKRLEETNLINAKLHYKNQALGSDSLNERQKDKIVEAVSKAGSVDEVKMIYETLCNAVGSFENKGPQSLSEAVEKKGGLTFKPRQKQESNSNPLHNRWQKIAGIKK